MPSVLVLMSHLNLGWRAFKLPILTNFSSLRPSRRHDHSYHRYALNRDLLFSRFSPRCCLSYQSAGISEVVRLEFRTFLVLHSYQLGIMKLLTKEEEAAHYRYDSPGFTRSPTSILILLFCFWVWISFIETHTNTF
jgi:hypothetical protein